MDIVLKIFHSNSRVSTHALLIAIGHSGVSTDSRLIPRVSAESRLISRMSAKFLIVEAVAKTIFVVGKS